MRFACVLVEHLPIRIERLLDPALAQQPLVVLRAWDSQVMDAAVEVEEAGIGPGDSRRRVEQLYPQATIRMGRDIVYQKYHNQLRAVAAAFASAVETYALGELFIEVGDLARTYPAEAELAQELVAQAEQATRLSVRVGIAANKFTAEQAARLAGSEPKRIVIIPDGAERRSLAPLPLTALPDLRVEWLRRLHLFGIRTIGGLAQLPHAAAVLQFGPELAIIHDLARGIDPRPLVAQAPPPIVSRRMAAPEPWADRSTVLTVLERLASRIADELAQSGYHAMALALTVLTADGQEHHTGAPLKPPSADEQMLERTAARLLGKLPLSVEVAGLALVAYPLRGWHHDTRQLALFEPPQDQRAKQLITALGQIHKRFGELLLRLASTIGPPLPVPIQVQTRNDGTPTRLRWRGWSHPVVSIYESWRERLNWRDVPIVRDYYEAVLRDEVSLFIFRDSAGKWFLDRRRL